MTEETALAALFSGLADSLTPAFHEAGLSSCDLEAGFESVRFGVAKIGLEMGQAESLGLSLAQAVRDAERFPTVHKLHNGILSLLTLELPPELANIAKSILASPPTETEEILRTGLARLACSPFHGQPERALARLLLFEALRLNLLVLTWQDRKNLIRRGIEDEALDTLAEAEVEWLTANPAVLDESSEVRPLHVLVSSALLRLAVHSKEAGEALASVSDEIAFENERRAKLDEALCKMDCRDALLIRNQFARALGEQRLSVERLMLMNPMAFGGSSRDALDQRRLRGVEFLKQNKPRQRKKPALVDLLLERHGENQ